ncbi:MAG: peptidase [Planctomycetota bacterium]
MKNTKTVFWFLVISLSLIGNVILFLQRSEQPFFIHIPDANSRETYFTLHHVKEAQAISRGQGISVGILDHYFGYEAHKAIYHDAIDFLNDPDSLNTISEHGYWMASVLKETAPGCEIYALNTHESGDEEKKVTAMIAAIEWAVDHKIDILTYSSQPISENQKARLDEAVNKAIENNVVIVFIHYDHPQNLWPNGMFSTSPLPNGRREPDINILHYDYNTLLLSTYDKYQKSPANLTSGDDIPYFSLSSTAPVTAGFVALLKGLDNTLAPQAYRDILRTTSYRMNFKDPFLLREFECPNVVDIRKAVSFLQSQSPNEIK